MSATDSEKRQELIDMNVAVLFHAVNCRGHAQPNRHCLRMKEFIDHEATCRVSGCSQCATLLFFITYHSERCTIPNCLVPRCKVLRGLTPPTDQEENNQEHEDDLQY